RALECSLGAQRRTAHAGDHRDVRRLALQPCPCQADGGLDQLTVRPHAVERVLRNGEVQLLLDGQRQLGEVEGVCREVFDKREFRGQFLLGDAEVLRYEPTYAWLDETPHTHL